MKKIIKTPDAPAPIGPYNQAVVVQSTAYFSGQIGMNPSTGELVSTTLEDETRQVMANIEAILKAINCDFSHIVKTSIFLSDMNNFAEVNRIYGSYFDEATAPARETVQVAKLPKDVNVEISMIAVK